MGKYLSSLKRKTYRLRAPRQEKILDISSGNTGINKSFFQTDELIITGLEKNGIALSDKPMRRVGDKKLYTSLITIDTSLTQTTFTIEKGLAFKAGQRVYLDNNTNIFTSYGYNDNEEPQFYLTVLGQRNDPAVQPGTGSTNPCGYFGPRLATIVSYDPQTGIIVFNRDFKAIGNYQDYPNPCAGPAEIPQVVTLRIRVLIGEGIESGFDSFSNQFRYKSLLCIDTDQDLYFFSSIDSEPTFNDNGIQKKIGFNYLFLRPDTLEWELGRCKIQGEADPLWVKLASNNDKIQNETHDLITWFYSTPKAYSPQDPYGTVNRRYLPVNDSFYTKNFKEGDFIFLKTTNSSGMDFWAFHIIGKLYDPTVTLAIPPGGPQNMKTMVIYRLEGDGGGEFGFNSVGDYKIQKIYSSLDLYSIPSEQEGWILGQGVTGAINFNKGPSGYLEGTVSSNAGSIVNTDKKIKIISGPTGIGNFSSYPEAFTGSTGFTGLTGGIYTYENETIYYSLVTPVTSEVERYKIDQFIKGLKSAGLWADCAFVLLNSRQNKFIMNEMLAIGGAIGVSSGMTIGGGPGTSSWAPSPQVGDVFNQYRYESYTQYYMWSNLTFYANTEINSIFIRPRTFFTTYYARTLYPPNNYGQLVVGGQGMLASSNINFYLAGIISSTDPYAGISLGSKRGNNLLYTTDLSSSISYGGYNRPWSSYSFTMNNVEQRFYKNKQRFGYGIMNQNLSNAVLPSSATYFGNGAEMSSSILFFSNITFTDAQIYYLHDLYKKTVGALNGSIYNIETEAITMNGLP